MIKLNKNYFYLFLIVLAVFNLWIWQQIVFAGNLQNPVIYFLDVGQGESQLILLPSIQRKVIKALIDGGRDKRLLGKLAEVLPDTDKYIDLVVLSHAHLDHFGGLISLLESYQIGTFIFNGKESENRDFAELQKILNDFEVPTVILSAGDRIKHLDNEFAVLSPEKDILIKENDNEASLTMLLKTRGGRALFTGDIGFPAEAWLLEKYNLAADVLKVAHHGSKNSSGVNFVKAVDPRISVIGVGKNRYGHPHQQVLDILEKAGAAVYRTDLDGTIKLILDE